MTNQQIIFEETQRLAAAGVLKYTGRTVEIEVMEGVTVAAPEVEEVHTFAGWKAAGYMVRRGEHARAAFPVWTYKARRSADRDDDGDGDAAADGDADGENPTTRGRCYMRKAFWFTREQVEKITA